MDSRIMNVDTNSVPAKRNHRGIILASAVVAGSLIPDLDHVFRSHFANAYGKGWGHNIYVPLAVLGIVAAAYLGRRLQTRLLKNEK